MSGNITSNSLNVNNSATVGTTFSVGELSTLQDVHCKDICANDIVCRDISATDIYCRDLSCNDLCANNITDLYTIDTLDLYVDNIYSWTESNVIIQDDISCIGPDGLFVLNDISCNGTMKVNAAEINGNAKTFIIDHPDPEKTDTHLLYHACIEAPLPDLHYRYQVNATETNGATIVLPDYFKFINTDIMTWISPVDNFGRGYVKVNEEKTIAEVKVDTDGKYNVLIVGTRDDAFARDYIEKGIERKK